MFWENFVTLCNKKNISPTAACAELGYSNAISTKWRKGATPRSATLHKIADYFGVSVDYLLGNEEKPKNATILQLSALRREESNVSEILNNNIRMIPVFESVSAGFGAMAHDQIVEYFPIYIESDFEASETLCIRVKGDSMYPKIEDGDLIQVHKQESVDSGAVAVVLVDGEEGYVKKVEYGPDWIVLHSFNPMYPPMRFEKSDVLRVRVIGLVRKIIKDI